MDLLVATAKMAKQNLAPPNSNAVALTQFDLPMEFHLDYLRQMLKTKGKNIQPQALIVSFSSMNKVKGLAKSKFKGFGLIKNIIQPPSTPKSNYDFVRDLALELLLHQTSKEISILGDTFDCGLESHSDEPLPHRMFSWTREDYLNRRQIPNCMWILVLQKSLSPKCLDIKKMKTDLECLQQFLELIFAAFKTENHKLKQHVQKFMEDALAYENILATLSKEYESNRVTIEQGLTTVLTLNFYRRDTKNFDHRTALEEQLVMANVWVPIEQRYQKKYYESRTNQHQIRADVIEEKLDKEMIEYIKMVERENFRSQCVITMLHEEVERYKRSIAVMSERYDKDYDAINNEISYKKSTMEKLKDQRKFYIEQIERFKEELEQSRLRMIFEEEVERNRLKKLAEWRKKLKKSRRRNKRAVIT